MDQFVQMHPAAAAALKENRGAHLDIQRQERHDDQRQQQRSRRQQHERDAPRRQRDLVRPAGSVLPSDRRADQALGKVEQGAGKK